MPRKKQSRGACVFCGKELTRSGMTHHLKTCPARKQAIEAAAKRPGRNQALYHLLVVDRTALYPSNEPGTHWLHLEIRGSATLEDLDAYLRAIWLECCGHLSAFEIGDIAYTQIFEDDLGWREERPMTVRVDQLFEPGMDIRYEYDFGTTSVLQIRVLDERKGKPLNDFPIFLMARNAFEQVSCSLCDRPATWFCCECMWELGREDAVFCEEHAMEHIHYDMLMPIYNSPRTGMCGYNGPAEPPY